jgi:FkbM family methyltransferase
MKARYLFRAFKARYRDQRQEIKAVLEILRPGDFAIDIGAHKGAYAFWLRRAVDSEGKVYAYEPQPDLAAYLNSVRGAMGWKNVFVRDCALSNRSGAGLLNVPGETSSPGASLHRVANTVGPTRQLECRVDTLDHKMENERRVSLLKVDVEGHELQVFQGGAKTLSRDGPVLLFECETRHLTDHTMEDVFKFLKQHGYQGKFFSPKGLLPLDEFNPVIHQKSGSDRFWDAPGYCNNFLFAKNSPSFKPTA